MGSATNHDLEINFKAESSSLLKQAVRQHTAGFSLLRLSAGGFIPRNKLPGSGLEINFKAESSSLLKQAVRQHTAGLLPASAFSRGIYPSAC